MLVRGEYFADNLMQGRVWRKQVSDAHVDVMNVDVQGLDMGEKSVRARQSIATEQAAFKEIQ